MIQQLRKGFSQSIFMLIVGLTIVFLCYGVYAFYSGAPFVPTERHQLKTVFSFAQLDQEQTMLDLGSGDGRVVIACAQTGARCVGIEINPILYAWSALKAYYYGYENVEFVRADFWDADLSEFDVMFLYFIPGKMERLQAKIRAEMAPDARLISHGFTFPGWQYQAKADNIYLYQLDHLE